MERNDADFAESVKRALAGRFYLQPRVKRGTLRRRP
jgi:hypothetical protein